MPLAPPPPAMIVKPDDPVCAVETLNSRLTALAQARDILAATEAYEDMRSQKRGAQTEMRQGLQDRVHALAQSLLQWSAHE